MWPMGGFGGFGGFGIFGLAGLVIGIIALVKVQNLNREFEALKDTIKELKGKNKITLFGNGERVSNFIHIEDVVESISTIINNPISGTYLLGHAANHSYKDIANNLIRNYGDDRSNLILKRNGLRCVCEIDTTKSFETFGIRCERFQL